MLAEAYAATGRDQEAAPLSPRSCSIRNTPETLYTYVSIFEIAKPKRGSTRIAAAAFAKETHAAALLAADRAAVVSKGAGFAQGVVRFLDRGITTETRWCHRPRRPTTASEIPRLSGIGVPS